MRLATACVLGFLAIQPAAPAAATVIAVSDFEDNSGNHLDDLGPATHDLLSSFLLGIDGVRVVSRERLHAVLREQSLAVNGLIGNRAKSTRIANLLGADYLITGSVFSFSSERRPFDGYGVRTVTFFHRMKVNMQIIDLETGEITFGKPYDVEAKEFYPQASSAPYQSRAKARDLIAALLEQASDDLRRVLARGSGGAAAPSTIKVEIATDPEGADIEIAGVYIGSTPATVELEPGVQLVRLSLAGHGVWEKKVQVAPGLRISAKLAPEQRIVVERE